MNTELYETDVFVSEKMIKYWQFHMDQPFFLC